MKKLLVMVIALAVVFGMSAGVMAEAEFGLEDNIDIDVNLSVEEYAEISTEDVMELNLTFNPENDGNYDSEKNDRIVFNYKVNTLVNVTASSDGFTDADDDSLDGLDEYIEYKFGVEENHPEYLKEFSPGTDNKNLYSSNIDSQRDTRVYFEVVYNEDNEATVNWPDVLAGEYTDTITFTVSAE